VQVAETFKLISEILTQQLVPRQTSCFFYDLLIIFVRGKADVAHFFKKCCLAALSVRNVIVFN